MSALQPLDWFDLRNALEQPPPVLDFVLPGLKTGTVGALVSPGGAGKTMLAMQMSVAIACGRDTLNLKSMDGAWRGSTGRVVFLTAEDPSDVLQCRFHAIGQHLPTAEREMLYENLAATSLVGRAPNLMNPEWGEMIERATHGARLVIIDTLRRFHQLDENDGGEMARLLAMLEILCVRNSTAVLFLHHTSKSGALNGGDTQQASRGSSVLTDNARYQANLVGMSPEQAKEYGVDDDCRRSFVRLAVPKPNYSAPIADQWFRRGQGGVLEPVDMSRPTVRKGRSREKI